MYFPQWIVTIPLKITCLNPPKKKIQWGSCRSDTIWHSISGHHFTSMIFWFHDDVCVYMYIYIYMCVYMYTCIYIYIYIITWFLRKDHKIHHKIHHKIRYDGLYDPDLLILWWIALYQSWWSSYYWSEEPIIIYYYIKNLIYLNIMIIFHDTLW